LLHKNDNEVGALVPFVTPRQVQAKLTDEVPRWTWRGRPPGGGGMEVKIKHFFAWENRVGGFAASDSQILAGTPQPESLGSTSSRRIFLSVFFAAGSRLVFLPGCPAGLSSYKE